MMKSPSTVKFSDVSAHEGGNYVKNDLDPEYDKWPDRNAWVVTGDIDSSNSYGATVRNDFNCRAIFNDGQLVGTEVGFIQ